MLDPNEVHLTLIENLSGKRGRYRCVCGTEKVLIRSNVGIRGTRSCGCLRRQVTRDRSLTHGASATKSRTYGIWKNMRQRCLNRDDPGYGGRGITHDPRWEKFEEFLADMGECPPGLTLERKDVNGNYEKSNCIWADWFTQNNNKRNVPTITHNGRTQSVAQWSREVRVSTFTIKQRMKAGLAGDALFAPTTRGPGYGRGGRKPKTQSTGLLRIA